MNSNSRREEIISFFHVCDKKEFKRMNFIKYRYEGRGIDKIHNIVDLIACALMAEKHLKKDTPNFLQIK